MKVKDITSLSENLTAAHKIGFSYQTQQACNAESHLSNLTCLICYSIS